MSASFMWVPSFAIRCSSVQPLCNNVLRRTCFEFLSSTSLPCTSTRWKQRATSYLKNSQKVQFQLFSSNNDDINNFSPAKQLKHERPLIQESNTNLNEINGSTSISTINSTTKQRMELLHDQLLSLTTINPIELHKAMEHAVMHPTEGYYSTEFGKSAIRTYKTYLYPKPSRSEHQHQQQEENPIIAAMRTARQIDFLVKRHKSHQLEWVRHHDGVVDVSTDSTTSTSSSKQTTTKFPLTILLDNIRSAFNVGSIFRTADACGCREVITAGITPHPFGSGCDKVSKTSLGADTVIPTRHFVTTKEAIDTLRVEYSASTSSATTTTSSSSSNQHIFIVGMETTSKSQCYAHMSYPKYPNSNGTLVLVFGNEVTGIDTEIMSSLDAMVEIPMFGSKNSLNVAACAPVVMYEVLRQWGAMGVGNDDNGEPQEQERSKWWVSAHHYRSAKMTRKRKR